VTFEVRIERERKWQSIFAETLDSAPPQTPLEPWVDRSVSLARFGGEEVRIEFRTQVLAQSPAETQSTSPLWGSPMIVPSANATNGAPPNLILISLDTLRADHLGVYGYGQPVSPNIDRIARDGVTFEQCIAPSAWTTPSHASLMTGLNPTSHGSGNIGPAPLHDRLTTLAELIARNGYLTAAYTGGSSVSGAMGFFQGFDRYSDGAAGSHERQGAVEEVFALGQRWIERNGNRPYFLFLHTYEIHSPYQPPDSFRRQLNLNQTLTRARFKDARLHTREVVALYDAEIAYTDLVLGRFYDTLAAKGLLDNTVIMIVSDHGEEFMDHGGVNHAHTLYDELVHVPFILRSPQGPHGLRIGEIVSLSDVFKTSLDLLDIPHEESTDSISVLSLLSDQPETVDPGRDSVVGLTYAPYSDRASVSIRTGDSKYIVSADWRDLRPHADASLNNSNHGLGLLLLGQLNAASNAPVTRQEYFDLSTDPHERSNLAQTHSTEAEQLRQKLSAVLLRFKSDVARYALEDVVVNELSPENLEVLEAMGYLD
jgi:arylsulfatase A-like enzyme